MSYGDTMTIGGLTLTATGTITQAEALEAFANLSAGATSGNTVKNGTWSGTLNGFNSVVLQVVLHSLLPVQLLIPMSQTLPFLQRKKPVEQPLYQLTIHSQWRPG